MISIIKKLKLEKKFRYLTEHFKISDDITMEMSWPFYAFARYCKIINMEIGNPFKMTLIR